MILVTKEIKEQFKKCRKFRVSFSENSIQLTFNPNKENEFNVENPTRMYNKHIGYFYIENYSTYTVLQTAINSLRIGDVFSFRIVDYSCPGLLALDWKNFCLYMYKYNKNIERKKEYNIDSRYISPDMLGFPNDDHLIKEIG